MVEILSLFHGVSFIYFNINNYNKNFFRENYMICTFFAFEVVEQELMTV